MITTNDVLTSYTIFKMVEINSESIDKKKRCKYINFEDDNYWNKNMNNKYDKIVVKKKK